MVYMDGTIHSLSTTTGSGIPWTLTVVSNPPSSGARLRYNGYPSLSDCVSWRSSLGNLFPHFPFLMQVALLFITPHGLWIIWRFTIAYKNGSSSGLGNSARMTESIWVGLSFSLSQKRLCTCGRPCFLTFYGIHVGSNRPTHVKFRHKIYQQNDFPLKDSHY